MVRATFRPFKTMASILSLNLRILHRPTIIKFHGLSGDHGILASAIIC